MTSLRIDGAADAPDGGTTIVFAWEHDAVPAIVYLGPRLAADTDLDVLAASRAPALPHALLDVLPGVSLLPDPAAGFTGHPGLLVHRPSTERLRLTDHGADAHGVSFTCEGDGTLVTLALGLDPETDVLRATTSLSNASNAPLAVDWLAAPVLPLPPDLRQRLRFSGRWCGEFATQREPIGRGITLDENRRGRTSHESFPGTVFLAPGTTERAGKALSLHLAWSGNHRILVERLPEGTVQVQAGRLDAPGETLLQPGETVRTPDLIVARSARGMNGASQRFHHHVRRRILSLPDPARARPVTVNSWEAIYFDHTVSRLRRLADAAARIGAERFVLDDGWFGRRDDDTTSLGDWWVDERKYPQGLDEIVDHVTGLGLEFGLWVEPEMVNEASDLFRAHPDWVLGWNGADTVRGRGQLVLDLTRPEVAEHLYERLAALLREHAIGYLKWDMNRNLVAPVGADGRPAAHRQTEALYALLDRLRADHPRVEIESCSSGGARVDLEILRRTHRFWASDSNDPVERMRIQMGFSHFLPPEVMGAHVGPAWCHTSGRGTALSLRTLVASWGHIGLELDLETLSEPEMARARDAVERHKGDRAIWHAGRLHRLDHPDPNLLAVMAVRGDSARVVAVQTDRPRDTVPAPLVLAGLADRPYRVRLQTPAAEAMAASRAFPNPLMEGMTLPGALLMEAGLQLPVLFAQTGLAIALEGA